MAGKKGGDLSRSGEQLASPQGIHTPAPGSVNEFPHTVKGNQIANQLTLKQADLQSLGELHVLTGS